MEEKGIYVKITDYDDVKDVLKLIREKLKEAQNTFTRIESIKKEEDRDFEEWKTMLTEVSGKINSINERISQ